jgi:hypothetical protein
MERALFVAFIVLLVLALLTFLERRTVKSEDAKVWVNTRSGLYYCRDSKMYGKLGPGSYERQGEALRSGYRPYMRQACPAD